MHRVGRSRSSAARCAAWVALGALTATSCGRLTTASTPLARDTARPAQNGEHVTVYTANHRYLQDANGQPFVLIGFGQEGRSTPEVIAQLAGKITYQRSYAVSWNRDRSANEYALGRPWPDVNGKCNMSTWNETYWDNLRDYLDRAQAAGITVGLTLWDGHSDLPGGKFGPSSTWNASRNVQGLQWAYDTNALEQFPNPSPTGSTSAERLVYYQRAWIERLLDELKPFPNVVLELDNETDTAPVDWWLWWADYIRSEGTFVIATSWNAAATIPDNVFSNDSRLDMKSYHDRSDASITSQRYGWNKIIVADADVECDNLDGDEARVYAWRSILRGGQWNDFVCFDEDDFPDTEKLDYYGILLGFLRTRLIRPWDMAPHNELVNSGLCMARIGYFYLAYTSSSVTVNLTTMPGTGTWEWFDPRTGATAQSGQVTGGGPHTFAIPQGGEDYALWIRVNGTASVDPPTP